MNLVEVKQDSRSGHPPFKVTCKRCLQRVGGHEQGSYEYEPIFADLDGKAFYDYYCQTCASALGAE